jgi:PhzF family phenazine biosynthesis protein
MMYGFTVNIPGNPETTWNSGCKIWAMHIPLFRVNAFAHGPFSGNPAAVCLLDSWLDDPVLRKVSSENNLPATAFLLPRPEDCELRWFTPLCEVRLCGHATMAAACVALNVLRSAQDTVRFATRFHGTLTVRAQGALLSMDFPSLFPQPCRNPPAALVQALGSQTLPAEVLEVNDTYFAVFDDSEAVEEIRPDFELLRRLHPFAVSVSAPGKGDADFVSRYFAPSYGVPEDPVTGSAHCALAPYWSQRLAKSQIHARQLSARGGELWCEMAGERVILTGRAVLTMRGTLTI